MPIPSLLPPASALQRSAVALASVDSAPLHLSPLSLQHFLGALPSLQAEVERHYTRQLLRAAYQVGPDKSWLP